MYKQEEIIQIIESNIMVKKELKKQAQKIIETTSTIIEALKSKKKLLVCGNGGSASDSQHMASEFIGRFENNNVTLPCIALTADSSMISSISNDFSWNQVFSKQINVLGEKGDILICITTSGKSKNILEAIRIAKEKGLKTIALTGNNELSIKPHKTIQVPSTNTARIQETHILLIHIICKMIENEFSTNT